MMRRPLLSFALLSAVLVVPTGVSAEGAMVEPTPAIISADELPRYIVEFEPGSVPVVVKADDPRAPEIARDATAEAIVVDVVADGGDLVHDYDDLPFVAVETDDAAALWDMPGVVGVTPEIRVTRSLDVSLDVIDAGNSDLGAAIGGQKADGAGVAVAIIDDGIDRGHPFFAGGNNQSRVVAEGCFTRGECPNGADTQVGVGAAAHHVFVDGSSDYHGTHVAGIAAGNSNGTSRIPRGVAGNADIVAVQVFGADGGAWSIDIDRALEWVYDQVVGGLDIAAVNMSLGGSTIFSGDCGTTSSTKFLVDDLASVGVTVVVAAGNSSSRIGVSWPACLPNVVPVGSTTDVDAVSSFSNIGPQVRDRGVVAPGSGICSSVPAVVLSTLYGCLNGTSMAAPHVAGLAALVRQADPTASSAEVKAALRTTPTLISDTRSSGTITGLRRINAWTATGAVVPDQGEIAGTITDTTGGGSAVLATSTVSVALSSTDQVSGPSSVTANVTTDSSGRYRVRVPAGTWSSIFTYSDYDPSVTTSSTVTAGGSVQRNVSVAIARGTVGGAIDQSTTVHTDATFTLSPTGTNTKPATTTTINNLPQDGSFSLAGIRIGTWSLQVMSGDYSSESIPVTVVADTMTSLPSTVSLSLPTGSIALTVTDLLGSAPVEAAFTIVATPEAPVGTRVTTTIQATSNAQGVMTLSNIRVGSWRLTINSDDYEGYSVSGVSVSLATTTPLATTVTPLPGSVTGAVSDPLATAQAEPSSIVVDDTISLTLTPAAPLNGRTVVSVSQSLATTGGSFAVTGVTPGEWTLTGTIFGFEPLSPTSVAVQPNGTVDLGTFALTRRTAVASTTPAAGPTSGGTLVTIRGRHLTGATGVSFGGVAADPATITVVDDTQITVLAPASSAGTVNVTVTTGLGASTDSIPFSFTPPSGGGGAIGGGGGGGALWPRTETFVAPPSGEMELTVIPSVGAVSFRMTGVYGFGTVTVDPRAGRPPEDRGGITLPTGWLDITSTVKVDSADICAPIGIFSFDFYGFNIEDLRLFHWENGQRIDITTRVDPVKKQVCGTASSFSPFAVGALQTRRLAGADRYETAASISMSEFSPGVNVAYVVTGEKFPDALAAGAAAGRESGPVLLTRFGSLPSQTRAELQRLKPKRVIVVGGPSVVTDSVLAEIRTAVGSAPVERVWGDDRFATSAQLSQRTFASAGTVYVGSGLGFTEILAASAAAGRDKAPLLLVPGTGPNAGVPLSVGLELARLKPTKVVVVGGSMLVAPIVVNQVNLLVPSATVTQIGGADAYDTASKIARTFSSGGTVFVATGDVFADGLAGGAVAASRGYAMVMVPPAGALPSTVRSALAALAPRQIKVLGGPAAVAYDIENSVAKYLPS